MLFQLFKPLIDMFEGERFRKVIDYNDTVSTPIVGIGNSSIFLLSSCIPDLILDDQTICCFGFGCELDADCCFCFWVEGAFGYSEEDVGFAHS
jgi:hypothetical protein